MFGVPSVYVLLHYAIIINTLTCQKLTVLVVLPVYTGTEVNREQLLSVSLFLSRILLPLYCTTGTQIDTAP